jgi:hypothetical protein
MGKHLYLHGQRFGKLTVLHHAGVTAAGKTLWQCACDCGGSAVVTTGTLRNGRSKSCGCWRRIHAAKINFSHGHSRNGARSSTLESWRGMKARCLNPNNKDYKTYGGRGITVCQRWLKFENFLADMGQRPKNKTIDRKDSDGDYEPSNCHWANATTQSRNRRAKTIQP